MDPIVDDLNEAQRRAVLHERGPLMVVAGAGSGKTRVITRRIAKLVERGVPAHAILALTFTNKAAGEMRERVERLGGTTVHVSTFHSACARFLRRDGELLGYPRDFSIYDTYDRDQCVRALISERGIATKLKPSEIGRAISRLKNLHVRPAEFRPGRGPADALLAEIYEPYEQRMRKLGALDFDDLLLRFLDLLNEFPDVAERYQRRFAHVLVDEFQDTNRVQYELTKKLLGAARDLCVVGDPDQSIYRFRGAELRNILDFERDFPDVVVVRLEQNYRSTANILAAAEGVIGRNTSRIEKRLVTTNDAGELLRVVGSRSPAEEAERLALRVRERLDEGVSASEIAVFYRTHFLSRAVEEAFRHDGVPYEVVGGLAFFERREIKDLLAYLRVAVNPLDDVSFTRIVNVPARGVGEVALARLQALANGAGMSLIEAACDAGVRAQLAGKAGKGLALLAETIVKVRAAGQSGARPALKALLEGTAYLEYACALGDPEDIARQENIQELVGDAASYDREVGEGLSGYLQHVSLLTNEDRADDEGPRVSLMTVHSAKGLEFEHVFVIGVEEGLFPHSRSHFDPDELEEERRLMYVALTRARHSVQIWSASQRMVNGETSMQTPSRFLDEIPRERLAADSPPSHGYSNWVRDADADDAPSYAQDSAAFDDLRVGASVVHEVYGRGVVRALTGRGISSRAVVAFESGDERTLMLEYAKLQVVPGMEEP